MKKAFATAILFLFIYGIPFKCFPVNSSKLICALMAIYILPDIWIHHKKISWSYVRILQPFTLVIFLLAYSSFITLIHRTYDFLIPYAYILFILEHLIGSLGIIYILMRMKLFNLSTFFTIYVNASFIQAVIVILMLISPIIKEFIYNLSKNGDIARVVNARYNGIRALGLAASTTADFSVLQSFSLIFLTFVVCSNNQNSLFNKLLCILKYFTILISVLLGGRTGGIGVIITIILFAYFIIEGKKIHTKAIKCGGLFLIISTLGILVFKFMVNATLWKTIINFAFEPFYRLIDEGRLGTSSTDILLGRMLIKPSVEQFLWGDGMYINPSGGYYMHTDIGYLRHLLFYGIVGSLLLYTFFFILSYKICKYGYYLYGKRIAISLMLWCIYIYIIHFKGDFMMGSGMIVKSVFLVYIFLSVSYINKYKRKVI